MAARVSPDPNLPVLGGAQTIPIAFTYLRNLVRAVGNTLRDHAQRLNQAVTVDGVEPMGAPLIVAAYAVAGVPAAADHLQGVIYVTNETGGAVLAFSDGVNWRRVTDRAIIS